MLRVVVSERGQPALPPVDLDAATIVIGSGAGAHVRLPAAVARSEHVRVVASEVGEGMVLDVGHYQIRIAPAPPGTTPSSPQRTESLARELVRGLLGDGAAPALEVERGPHPGARRMLPPPEATFVIGRGDDAHWVIDDADLSRAHVELRRGWDGVTVRDLDSQHGTVVDGKRIRGVVPLRDGARLVLGSVVLRFIDPAERHLASAPLPVEVREPAAHRSPVPFAVAVVIAVLAIAALGYLLVS